ncbi:hypothetical protein F5141DRAFT_624338 [Pisolithus sp. B1]|nr:hypothetical protein F5141DRAFT_624338 [Pisolithus sp. B1]
MQDHASNYIIPPYAIEQSSGCPQESGDVSTFGDLDNNFARHTMYLGPIPSLHDCTSGQVTGSDAPLPRLSNPLLPSFQELHPSDDFTTGNIPPQPEQIQAEFERICPWTPFPSTYPIPSESNSLSYSVFDGYVPFFPMLNRNSSSWSPQEHLGYPISIHPHYTTPVDLPGFHEFDTGSKMELHTLGILGDNYAAQALGDRPSRTPPDYKAHPFCDYATYIPDDHTIGGGVDDYGNFDESKFNSEQVVGLRPQLPLPPNQLPLSPRDLHSYDRVSHIEGGSLSRTFHHRRRSATTRSRLPTRLPKVRLVCCHNVPIPCGWRDDQGRECGMPVNCGNRADHFAAAHGIKKKAWYFKITCRWCPSELPMEVVRKNFSRHVKEVHLGCPRSERGI